MKFLHYRDMIINANRLIHIKKCGQSTIEILFLNEIVWYVLSVEAKQILGSIRYFLSNEEFFYDIDEKLRKIDYEKNNKKEEQEEEENEFSYFAPQ